MNKNTVIRLVFYLVGLAIMTIGIAVSVKSDLGVSPVSTIPYTMTVVWGIEMGIATIIFHIALVLIQFLLLRKDFKANILLQVPVGILFGFLTSASLFLATFIPTPEGIVEQLILSLISVVLIAIGIFMYVPANFIPLAGEGAMLAVSKVTKIKFSTAKMCFDISMVVISLITCLALIQSFGSIGIGTIIAAFLVGICLKGIVKIFGPARDKALMWGIPVDETVGVSLEELQTAKDSEDKTATPTTTAKPYPLMGIMNTDVYTVPTSANFREVLTFLSKNNISGAPVISKSGKLAGFVSEGDILRYLSNEHSLYMNDASFEKVDFDKKLNSLLDMNVSKIATKRVISVNITDDLGDVCYKLAENHLKKAPVMNGGKMVGIVNRSDITSYATGLAEVL